jgi:hypothetical protein
MLSSIPTSTIKSSREEPPELKKGSDTPVGGIDEVTTATFNRL